MNGVNNIMKNDIIDEEFIAYWKSIDFTRWNESDVREEFIAPLLKILGYSKRTVNDVIREKSLNLSTPYHRIGRKKVSIDYVPTIRLKSFWIIEAKPGNNKDMDYGDLLQAHLYATHPEIQVPLIVLCNGWSIRIYDSLRINDWNEPIFDIDRDNCSEKFAELKEILCVKTMLKFQRKRILDNIRNTFLVEIDSKNLLEFKHEFNNISYELQNVIDDNSRQLSRKFWREKKQQCEDRLKQSKPSALKIYMDILTYTLPNPHNEYIRRIKEADENEKINLVNELAMYYRGRPHSIFKVRCLHVFFVLLKENIEIKETLYCRSVKSMFEEIALNNLTYNTNNQLSNALCHLENTCCRLAKKLSMKFCMDYLSEQVERLKKQMSIEDLLKEEPTVAKEMIKIIEYSAEFLWRLFCCENDEKIIWEAIWYMEDLEKIIDTIPDKEYPDDDSDLLWFESYGKGFDMLFMGTWMLLNKNIDILISKNLNEKIIEYALKTHEEAINCIPEPKRRPYNYKHSKYIIEKMKKITSLINVNNSQ